MAESRREPVNLSRAEYARILSCGSGGLCEECLAMQELAKVLQGDGVIIPDGYDRAGLVVSFGTRVVTFRKRGL